MTPPKSDPSPTTICIVDDDPVLARAFESMIRESSRYEVVGTARSATAARAMLSQTTPDIVLLDLGLPDQSGLELIGETKARLARTRIVVISVYADAVSVVSAIERGADGYLLKGLETADLVQVLDTVMSGGAPISPSVAAHVLRLLRHDKPAPKHRSKLSPREVELLEHLAKGYSVKECAALLNLSHHTVAWYVKEIYKKLEVSSRQEAVFEAVQSGWIRISP